MKYLAGKIDTHVHSSPDVRERKMSDIELMTAAVEHHVRGIVIKSHVMSTAARAMVINELCENMYGPETGFEMFGGITLNYPVGGLNPWAVETALTLGGKIVWLPTIHAEHEIKKNGENGGIACVEAGNIVEELKTIFRLVKDYDAAIATSHLSPREIFIVTEAARETGIKKIMISHPESNLVGLTDEEQIRLVKDYGVMLERCYAQPVGGGNYKSNLESNYNMYCKLGPDHIILATDAGQKQNPYWYESFEESIKYFAERGVDEKDIYKMTYTNPANMLGLELG